MSTTKKIQHLLEEIEKSKDIEKRLVGVLKVGNFKVVLSYLLEK